MNIAHSIHILKNVEIVWEAITDDHKLTQWYAPGSPWSIPELSVDAPVTFTLLPNIHNQLPDGSRITMNFKILDLVPLQIFSIISEDDSQMITFQLESKESETTVYTNMEGLGQSLDNLKAFIEGNTLPHV
ncbi:SRPBCC domain-containing protein [Staphylococcus sp. GSSP0090]|nr:SRPBCC domain-containing protein [Staphylococcus sp. GSSP0090]